MKLFIFALVVAVAAAEEFRAIVLLQGGGNYVHGNISLRQTDDGPVAITGVVTGLSQGLHGFHIHEKGDITGGCLSTGGHFNPQKHPHGAPTDQNRHAGDLGNILANANGVANIDIRDDLITLCTGPNNVLGRAIVVHSGQDDLGKGGQTDSLTTGHAGQRVTCGVIGIQSPTGAWPIKSGAQSASGSVMATLMLALSLILCRS